MGRLEIRDLEFGSDGISDSLTLTMSPALFHESLKREISTAKRDGRDISIVSISLTVESFPSISALQQSLIELAFTLRNELRGGDFFARTSDVGFWVLIRAPQTQAHLMVERTGLARRDDLRIDVVERGDDEHDAWVERIDQIHFFGRE